MALFGPLVIGGSQAVSQPLVEEININFLARVAHHVPTVPLEMLRIKEQGKTYVLERL